MVSGQRIAAAQGPQPVQSLWAMVIVAGLAANCWRSADPGGRHHASALAQLCDPGGYRKGPALCLRDLGSAGGHRICLIGATTIKVFAQQVFAVELRVHYRDERVHPDQLSVEEHEFLRGHPEVPADG